jgi:NADPH:quinone reductase-like Zn-dependent oxidoreductase
MRTKRLRHPCIRYIRDSENAWLPRLPGRSYLCLHYATRGERETRCPDEFGNADVLQIEDVVVGEPGAGEVRLRLHAIGLNRTEVTLRSDRLPVKVVPPFEVFARDLTIRGLALTAPTRDDAQLTALKRFVSEGIADGTLRPTIARTFAFDEIAAAYRNFQRD